MIAAPTMGRKKTLDAQRLVDQVLDGRRDELLVECSRFICGHFGRMAEHFSRKERRPVTAHNNRLLFLEAIDIFCRSHLSGLSGKGWGSPTEDPKDIVAHVMTPYFKALELEDPAKYRMPRQNPPPAYKGNDADATCMMLALCAAIDVTPLRLRFGLEDGEPERVWGQVYIDGKWYDSDVLKPELRLGEHDKFDDYQEVDIPL